MVYFKQVLSLAPQIIVKIVMNFISLTTLKSELPVRDITAGLVTLLREISFSGNGEYLFFVNFIHKDFLFQSELSSDYVISTPLRHRQKSGFLSVQRIIYFFFEIYYWTQDDLIFQLNLNPKKIYYKWTITRLCNKHRLLRDQQKIGFPSVQRMLFFHEIYYLTQDDLILQLNSNQKKIY